VSTVKQHKVNIYRKCGGQYAGRASAVRAQAGGYPPGGFRGLLKAPGGNRLSGSLRKKGI
jgi:hypothetical protein